VLEKMRRKRFCCGGFSIVIYSVYDVMSSGCVTTRSFRRLATVGWNRRVWACDVDTDKISGG